MYKLQKCRLPILKSLRRDRIKEKKADTPPQEVKKNSTGGLNGLLSGIFPDGKLDNDKIIIIALIVILAKEGADLKLLLALGYILM